MPALNVWMNGELVGEWAVRRSLSSVFRYTQSWLDSPRARALSLSLPVTADREIRGAAVDHYFDNLLPGNADIRRRIRTRVQLELPRFDGHVVVLVLSFVLSELLHLTTTGSLPPQAAEAAAFWLQTAHALARS